MPRNLTAQECFDVSTMEDIEILCQIAVDASDAEDFELQFGCGADPLCFHPICRNYGCTVDRVRRVRSILTKHGLNLDPAVLAEIPEG